MLARGDKRRRIMAVLLAVAMLAVAVPTYVMVGCDMGKCDGMTSISTQLGTSFGDACDGTWLASATVTGVIPGGFITILLTLIAAMAAAVALFSPSLELRPVRLVRANAPPPPLDPRGERYIR
jgi:hypothetical protein